MPRTIPQLFCCYQCEASVDPVRSVAKVIGAQVVRLCADCSSGKQPIAIVTVPTSEPAQTELEGEANTVVSTETFERATPTVPFAKTASHFFGLRVVLALVLLLATPLVALAFHQGRSTEVTPVLPTAPKVAERPKSELLSLSTSPLELVAPPARLLAEGVGWVHPVAGSEEQVPSKRTRLFKAVRPGTRPKECGRGHCGVDLDGPRGTPVVAIRDGIIEKVVHDRDAKGGRYVWILHEDIGLRTEYFHFDRIAPDVRAGQPVEAGQWLGTLGRTGIEHAEPHLHFTVRDVQRGLLYIDPKPWLAKAEILPLLDLRLASAEFVAAD